jgi:hypothetical protein
MESTVQTGPKIMPGGVQDGRRSVRYQVLSEPAVNLAPIAPVLRQAPTKPRNGAKTRAAASHEFANRQSCQVDQVFQQQVDGRHEQQRQESGSGHAADNDGGQRRAGRTALAHS